MGKAAYKYENGEVYVWTPDGEVKGLSVIMGEIFQQKKNEPQYV